MKLKKFSFFANATDYLRHVVRLRRLKILSNKTDAIKEINPPANLLQLHSFLSLCNVFQRFVPNIAAIATLLNLKLLKIGQKKFGVLTAKEATSIKKLQILLIALPVLT